MWQCEHKLCMPQTGRFFAEFSKLFSTEMCSQNGMSSISVYIDAAFQTTGVFIAGES